MQSAKFHWSRVRPVVAILRGVTPIEAPSIGRSLVDSGINAMEVPLNSPRPFDSIRELVGAIGDIALVGAGTVLCVEGVKRAADAGGQFVVSPNTNPTVIQATLRAGLGSMPGALTPSEALAAVRAGANALKVFPAGALGPAYIRDLSAVLPDGVSLFAVGGVSLGNVGKWLEAGARGVGIGTALYRPGDTPAQVMRRARALLRALEPAGSDDDQAPGIDRASR